MKPNIILSRQILPFCFITLVFNSCYPGGAVYDPYIVDDSRQKENYYYAPSSHNAPFLKEKNDLSASLQATTNDKQSGFGLQAAYLPHKNIGIITSYTRGDSKDSKLNSNYTYGHNNPRLKYNHFEMGAGYISRINTFWHFETYAGFGSGKIDNKHHTGRSKIKNNYFFLQPALAVSNERKTIQFGFVSKFTGNNFNIMDTTFANAREPFSTSQMKLLNDEPFHIFWEPSLVFRFGWNHFLFHTGYSFSADLTNDELHRAKGNFSIGLYLKFNTR